MEMTIAHWFTAPGLTLDAVLALPLDPSRRLFWGFLLSSALLAAIVIAVQTRRADGTRAHDGLSSRAYWRDPSHLTDIGLLVLNTALRLVILVPLFGSHVLATIYVARFWQSTLGTAPELEWAAGAVALTYTLVFFVVEDASRFGLHRAMHRYPLLWRLHRVHHSAPVLSPLTLHRVHPLEMGLYYLRGLIVFGLVSGTFVYLFGRQLGAVHILGVDALGFLFNLAGANLRHSHVWLSFGPLERLFVSPAQHQLHHSVEAAHHGRNFGTCLAVWDRLAGSWLRAGQRPANLAFGLDEQPTPEPSTHQSPAGGLAQPG